MSRLNDGTGLRDRDSRGADFRAGGNEARRAYATRGRAGRGT
jgi:hypothetical protein